MLKDFKNFLMRGNIMDLAVAVVIGGAFGAIIKSLVDDIIMPIVGAILGGTDFSTLMITVGDAQITYGNFLQAIVNFVIIAFAIFLMLKAYAKTQEEEAAAPPPGPSAEEKLLAEIRDLLKK